MADAADALIHEPNGALVVDDEGVIEWCGDYADLPERFESATVVDHPDSFLLPGFIDTHMHYPQVNSIDSSAAGNSWNG